MVNKYTRQNFMASYFEAMSTKANERGWISIIPLWLILSLACGAVVAYALPARFWEDAQWSVSVALYAALLTVNGLIIAVSWNAFSRIHDSILSSRGFALFLKSERLLNLYLFYIDYVQATQLVALFVSAAALFSLLVDVPHLAIDRLILAVSLGLSAYAIKYAVNAVTVMHDLVWQKAIFEEQEELAKDSKIVSMGRNGG